MSLALAVPITCEPGESGRDRLVFFSGVNWTMVSQEHATCETIETNETNLQEPSNEFRGIKGAAAVVVKDSADRCYQSFCY